MHICYMGNSLCRSLLAGSACFVHAVVDSKRPDPLIHTTVCADDPVSARRDQHVELTVRLAPDHVGHLAAFKDKLDRVKPPAGPNDNFGNVAVLGRDFEASGTIICLDVCAPAL